MPLRNVTIFTNGDKFKGYDADDHHLIDAALPQWNLSVSIYVDTICNLAYFYPNDDAFLEKIDRYEADGYDSIHKKAPLPFARELFESDPYEYLAALKEDKAFGVALQEIKKRIP